MAEGLETRSEKVEIVGHSFVRRFGVFLQADDSNCNLGLDIRKYKVTLHGFGGLSLHQQGRLHSVDARLAGADLVVVDIGSNDLCDRLYRPEQFALDLIVYAKFLLESVSVRKVVICQQLLRREDVTPYPEYNAHIVEANIELRTRIEESNCPIFFWKHIGMWNSSVPVLGQDGIHLSMESGYPKYLRSLRSCIIRTTNWCK